MCSPTVFVCEQGVAREAVDGECGEDTNYCIACELRILAVAIVRLSELYLVTTVYHVEITSAPITDF